MRSEDHIGAVLQATESFAPEGTIAVIGVEDPLLVLDDIQCSAAEPAGLQLPHEGIRVDQSSSRRVHHDRAVLEVRNPMRIQEMAGAGIERGMKRDDITRAQQLVEGNVIGRR